MFTQRHRDPLGICGHVVDQKYRIGEAVGEGGFSVVYRAEHVLWRQPVAMKLFKVVADAPAEDKHKLLEGFVQEGALLAELSSRCPAIVQARDAGAWTTPAGRWTPYIALEWLDGEPLNRVLRRERAQSRPPRSIEEAILLLEPIAVALTAVHASGVAHRDVKPGNVLMLDRASHGDECDAVPPAKLLDFGVAKIMADDEQLARSMLFTGDGDTAFTPRYGAPEQFDRSFGGTGPWTDVFALALILVELVTGERALRGDDHLELAASSRDPHRRPTPRRRGVSVTNAVEAAFCRALSVRPEHRHASVGELWEDLHAAVHSAPWSTLGPSTRAAASLPPAPTSRTIPRPADLPAAEARPRTLALVALAAASLSAGGGAALAWWHRQGPPPSASSSTAIVDAPPSGATLACPPDMALVPAGKFFMGSDDPALPASRPAHKVALGAFCIDVHEVTIAQYRACSERGECKRAELSPRHPKLDGVSDAEHERIERAYADHCNEGKPGRDQHPVNCVRWPDADAYCRFIGKRLPTEAEWEYAARGSDGRVFPWGDDAGSARHMNACGLECTRWEDGHSLAPSERMYEADDGFAGTAPVGSFPDGRTRFGLLDMVGNVWEWTADGYEPYGSAEVRDPVVRGSGERRAIRGGAFNGGVLLWLNPAYRYHQIATASSPAIGFRCASSVGSR